MKKFYEKARSQLYEACKPQGILASTLEIDNYARVWTRDSVICGLSGWILEDKKIQQAFESSLLNIKNYIGPHGEVPSNVQLDEDLKLQSLSYGTKVGRIDALGWFVIGACHLLYDKKELESEFLPAIKKVLDYYSALEINQRGLVYTPQGGNWADDYITEGYLLYDQLIRLWALRAFEKLTGDNVGSKELTETVKCNFWINEENKDSALYKKAYEEVLKKPLPYWACGIKPGGYDTRFDFFANTLTWLLQLNNEEQKKQTIEFISKQVKGQQYHLLPAFAPVIEQGSADYKQLEIMCGPEFKNRPHEYHNGGVWPMLNGFWGLALNYNRLEAEAQKLLDQTIQVFNANNQQFFEYYHGINFTGNGTNPCTWSAATPLALSATLSGNSRKLLC